MLVKVEHSQIEADNTGALIMAKTFSFAILHFTVAFTVGYLLTGRSWSAACSLLLSLPVIQWRFIFMKKHGNGLKKTALNSMPEL
jgi:hypothetical protein